MKKQMTVMDMGIVFAAVIVAIIALIAVQRLNTPVLPAIQSSSPVISKDVEKSEAPAIGNTAVEGTKQYSTVVFNPSTGQAEAVEFFAPSASSLETAAAPEIALVAEGQKEFRTVVVHPETGAQLYEWQAPSVSSLETVAAPETALAAEGQKEFRTVVVHPQTGAQLYEWQAPSVSSVNAAKEMGTYSTVVVDKAAGNTEVIEWQAPKAR